MTDRNKPIGLHKLFPSKQLPRDAVWTPNAEMLSEDQVSLDQILELPRAVIDPCQD